MVLFGSLALFSLTTPGMTNDSEYPYIDKWKEVSKYIDNGKPKSALEVVEAIHAQALTDQAKPHLLRSIIMRHKLAMMVEEIEYATLIQRMEQEITATGDQEVKALLQSATAAMYSRYVMQHSYKLHDRITIGNLPDEVNAWSIADIEQRADQLMRQSLQHTDLEDLVLADFVLHDDSEIKVNPMRLKPYLIQQGIYHFENELTSMTRIKDQNRITQSQGLSVISEYLEVDFGAQIDSDRRKESALALYQRLLSYYQDHPVILAKIDVKRLDYAESIYLSRKQTIADLQSDYIVALRQGMQQSNDPNQSAVYGITLAKQYYILRSQYQNEYDQAYSQVAIEALEIADSLNPTDKNLKAVISDFQRQVKSSALTLTLDEVILPNVAVPYALNVKNISDVHLSIHRLTVDQYREAKMKSYEDGYHKALKKLPQNKQWTEALDAPRDYLDHSTEGIIPSLDLGQYVMFVEGKSSTQGKSSEIHQFVLFQVSSQEVVKWASEDGNTLQVIDRLLGNPIKGAKIELYSHNRRNRSENLELMSTLTTDQDGKTNVKSKGNVYNMSLVSTAGADILVTDFYYQKSGNQRRQRSKPHVFMDRSIYRPGQLLQGKLVHLTYDSENTPSVLKDTDITIKLKDANNQEIASKNVKTNDYGVSVFSMTLPSNGLKGNYRLYFQHADGSSSTQIKVEEYRRPTLESAIDPVEGTVVLGDTVSVSGSVNTLSGFPSQGAQVSYTISESPYFEWYRCGWSSRWYPPYQSPPIIIETGETTTDLQGNYKIDFGTDRADMSQRQQGKQYTIDVVITDQSGETLTNSKSVYVTSDHFRIDHTLPTIINQESTAKLSPRVRGLNLDGQAIAVESKITIQMIQSTETYTRTRDYRLDYLHYSEPEFDSKETHYDYPTLGKGEALDQRFKAITVGVDDLQSTLSQLKPGDYKLTISGTSAEGYQAEGSHRVLVYDSKQESPHLLMYSPGQTVTAEVGSDVVLPVLIHDEVDQVYYKKIRGRVVLEEGWLTKKEFLKKRFPVTQSDMGGFTLDVACNLKGDRAKTTTTVSVPYVDTDIEVTLDLDSLLLPGTAYQLGAHALVDGKPLADGNMTLVMYDAALDQLYPHSWQRSFYPTFYSQVYEQTLARSRAHIQWINRHNRNNNHSNAYLDLNLIPYANWYGIIHHARLNHRGRGKVFAKSRAAGGRDQMMYSMEESAPPPAMMADAEMSNAKTQNTAFGSDENSDQVGMSLPAAPPVVRSDFGETVFFDTDGITDTDGNYTLDFETNDAITQWKILAFAHDRDMRYGFAEMTIQTSKPVQIIQTPTRTLSEGDAVQWPITVQNSSDASSSGVASIQVLSYLTQADVTDQFIREGKSREMTVPAGEARTLVFDLLVPMDYKDRVEVITQYLSEDGSDAESRNLPVYSTDQYLTSGDPIWLRPGDKTTYRLTAPTGSKTEALTLEIASNPFWMVARSFPILSERDDKITTSLSDHVVVESIGQQILGDYPEIERVMSSQVLQSEGTPLNRNEDLKIQELSNTPWVRQAEHAETRVADFAKYFNKNNSTQRLKTATSQLWNRQNGDGGWPWIAGGRSSLYTSQRVLIDLAQIQELGVSAELTSDLQRLQQALDYTDREIDIIRKRSKHKEILPALFINDLYLYSLLPQEYKRPSYHSDWLRQLEEQWTDLSLPYQALVGKIMVKNGNESAAQKIKESLLERAITRKDGTVFWREINEYYTYHNSYSTQVLVLGFLNAAGVRGDIIDRGSQWLIANKRSNEWYDERGTAAVVYYLYQQYGAQIDDGDGVSVTINGKEQTLNRGLTYSTLDLDQSDYNQDLDIVMSNSEDYPVFGGVYRQFFQPIDQVTRHPAAENLSIKKSIYVKTVNGTEVTYQSIETEEVRVGDELKVRLEIESFDRLSYVYVTDTRPAGTEPTDQLSGYTYRNGLYIYQSPNDKGQEFFLEVLPKGKHTLEYSIRVLHAGDVTSGIAEIQSFYVPEFSAYDSHGRVETLPLSLDSKD